MGSVAVSTYLRWGVAVVTYHQWDVALVLDLGIGIWEEAEDEQCGEKDWEE